MFAGSEFLVLLSLGTCISQDKCLEVDGWVKGHMHFRCPELLPNCPLKRSQPFTKVHLPSCPSSQSQLPYSPFYLYQSDRRHSPSWFSFALLLCGRLDVFSYKSVSPGIVRIIQSEVQWGQVSKRLGGFSFQVRMEVLQVKHPSWPLGCGVDTEKAFLTEGRAGAVGSRPGAPLFSTV